ncbi:N-methylhydantoinase B/oxoprolinase/acetone carboxylase alpha subunit [Rhizobium petrolearium]|uniref:hypothetical protein n=1 Tax=Neorhizobium petrolearium TaxID=515361 RepID=UPI001AE56928|nr:hypothetical protein [Neorhizobium petrolearium]MBP1845782.1 N-methylhydantoinase B/oxoprolinase/acetone carboxylase alpha subunit [Neorhizobium petrolearium]
MIVSLERLLEMMEEFELTELDELADHIIDTSREGVLAKIRKLPKELITHPFQLELT